MTVPGPAPRPELSGRATARLLLAAGTTLVVIAAMVFAVANWSSVGPLGRFALLLAVSVLVLAAPVPLASRGLNATAESVAAIGLALTIADAYLAGQAFPGAPGPLGVAAGSAILAAVWAGYGAVAAMAGARLTGPRLAAIAAAQLPVPIVAASWAYTLGDLPGAYALGAGLALTSGADALLAGWAVRRGKRAEAGLSIVAAAATWFGAFTFALFSVVLLGWLRPTNGSGVALVASSLALVALVGLSAPPPDTALAAPAAVVSGALLAIALAVPAVAVLPPSWRIGGYAAAGAVCSAVALALARTSASRSVTMRLRLAAAGSAAILGLAGLAVLPGALKAMFPLTGLFDTWSGYPISPGQVPPVTPLVLGLVGAACLLGDRAVTGRQYPPRAGLAMLALVAATLAAGSFPAVAHLDGWAAIAVLTACAAVLIGAASGAADAAWTGVACGCAIGLAASAARWSLFASSATVAECAALTVIFGVAAALARNPRAAWVATVGAVVAATGLAGAVPLAMGWPARYAAFGVLGVAIVAIGAATMVRRARPAQAGAADLCAGPVVLLAAGLAAGRAGTFASLATTAAALAAATAWLRGGLRRAVALVAACCAAVAAMATQGRSLAQTLIVPFSQLARAWRGPGIPPTPGLAFAVLVIGGCAAALVAAAGAWRGGRASLDAVAVALPLVAAPTASLAIRSGYWIAVALLLALTVALAIWAALSKSAAPAGAALAAASIAVAWALARPAATLIVLGCLAVTCSACAAKARLAGVRLATACLAVLCAAALAECAVLATAAVPTSGSDLAWQAGLAGLAVAVVAQVAAVWAGAGRLAITIELTGWLVAIAALTQCLFMPGPAVLALALSGTLCLGVALRRNRRPALWVGLVLYQAGWCVWLAATGVLAPEPYTLPASAIAIAFGLRLSRRGSSSWLSLAPGLALLMLPSLIVVWGTAGLIRPVLLAVAATGVALAGARLRWQAPLLLGAAVTIADAGRQLAPAIRALPAWLPIAALGVLLIWAGATYEARLRGLRRLGQSLAAMR